ncbi:penicillin acylase family protein [Pseudonocardia acaciae]|uniref:penicillin acylase family protein n=1 Tax=Pseudonocardia acaciae TaxID=551276 RepID=UPI0006890261|nr:penicillin acylase family protein [Pseudonocardia acaciae]
MTEYVLPGLTGPAEIVVDRWGIPHIYAGSTYDAFRAQGFNAARDRLWQIDFWRRRGLGRLAEVFGAEHVERDRAARLFLFRGDMHAEWLAYGSDTKRVATAFVEGVNAYVRLTRDDPSLLPVEFRELGYLPALWEPADVARIRSHGLFYNLREEVARALVLRDFPPEVEALRRRREPERPLCVPDGLDLSLIPDDVLRVYDLATVPPEFGPTAGVPAGVPPEGSNNWVLAGARTATGRPLLANDPHRTAEALPGLRYLAHLSAPGFDVIGAGEPALPGISIGHNGRIAFGLTIFPVDQEDLYVYRTNPDNPREYRYRDRWEPMRVEHETIPVRGGDPVEVELLFTRHGPVIYTDEARRTAFAVRAAWLEPGMAPYLGSMDYMRARDWDEFLAAMNRWGAPPENQVYADPAGNIGWKAGGLTPIRPNWDGGLPVPGDGRYEWAGFYDMDELPGESNPERGFIATANEMNLPKGFPPERHITYDWYAPYRRQRIDEVLSGCSEATAADMVALQSDFVSVPARRIVAAVSALELPPGLDGLDLLRGWNADLRADSAAAALFEVWYRRHLRPALVGRALEPLVGPDRVAETLARIVIAEDQLADARVDLGLVENAGPALAEIVSTTLPAAVAELEGLLGTDRAAWQWGRLHVARPTHPLRPLLTSVPPELTAAGPVPRGGSGDTVGATSYGPKFVQASGATFRIAVDVGDWDSSLVMNAPGQSGRLDDPHYTDLVGPWSRGEAFPLVYSRERVDEVAERVISLHPPSTVTSGARPAPGGSPGRTRP